MQRLVPTLFAESPIEMCFITFSSTITFFNISASAPRPQMAVMPDLEQSFPPLPPKAFIQSYPQAKENIDKLLQLLPSMYAKPEVSSIGAGSALQVVVKILTNAKSIGKIFLFASGLPEVGQGKVLCFFCQSRANHTIDDQEDRKRRVGQREVNVCPSNSFLQEVG
jgi:hypothetical protein